MEDLWSTDGKILAAIVRHIEIEGRGRADLAEAFAEAEVSEKAGNRAVERLADAGMVKARGTFDGSWFVLGVTERGLREVGAWPSGEQYARKLLATLEDVAENDPDPVQRSKARRMLNAAGEFGYKALIDLSASVVSKIGTGA